MFLMVTLNITVIYNYNIFRRLLGVTLVLCYLLAHPYPQPNLRPQSVCIRRIVVTAYEL